MIFPIWQEFVQSSHILAQECGEILGEPATHTGTLDPMAEGVLIVLTGEDRYAKSSFSDWSKRYRFSILWGVASDSTDRLGLIKGVSPSLPDVVSLQKQCLEFPPEYQQRVPQFSARRWQGKSAFDWARLGESLPEKHRRVRIEGLSVLGTKTLGTPELWRKLMASVSVVQGEFRQDTVLESWSNALKERESTWCVTEHEVWVSAGTYVRQLVQDLTKQQNMPALTWSITREENGPYARQDCVVQDDLRELIVV